MSIVIICGLPGVGKTTVAKKLAPLLNAVILSTDKIRKELFKSPTYSKKEKNQIYDVMILMAKYLHTANISCILDATFNKSAFRNEVKRKLGIKTNHLHIVECVCSENLIISRLKSRKNDYSDAGIKVYKKMKKIREPITEKHIQVNTGTNSADVNAKFIYSQILGR